PSRRTITRGPSHPPTGRRPTDRYRRSTRRTRSPHHKPATGAGESPDPGADRGAGICRVDRPRAAATSPAAPRARPGRRRRRGAAGWVPAGVGLTWGVRSLRRRTAGRHVIGWYPWMDTAGDTWGGGWDVDEGIRADGDQELGRRVAAARR